MVVTRAGSCRPRWQALRMVVSLAATRDGKHRPRSIVFYDTVAAFVHASMDEVVGAVLQDGLLEKGECFLLLKPLYGTRMASKRWQRHYMRVLRTHGWSASRVMLGFFHHGDDFMAEGSDVLLDRVMKDVLNAKMLDVWVVASSLKSSSFNGHCAGMGKRCASVGAEAHDTSQSSPCCLDLQTLQLRQRHELRGRRQLAEALAMPWCRWRPFRQQPSAQRWD